MSDNQTERDRTEEVEFFSTYAKNYAEPEVIWLAQVIGNVNMMGPESIARRVLAAGYQRPPMPGLQDSNETVQVEAENEATRDLLAGVRCEAIHGQIVGASCVNCQSWAMNVGLPSWGPMLALAIIEARPTRPASTDGGAS